MRTGALPDGHRRGAALHGHRQRRNIGGRATSASTIPPGQQASFRPGALHTVIVVGDEPYSQTTPGEPARDEVVGALQGQERS